MTAQQEQPRGITTTLSTLFEWALAAGFTAIAFTLLTETEPTLRMMAVVWFLVWVGYECGRMDPRRRKSP
jgi:hypothetical protein